MRSPAKEGRDPNRAGGSAVKKRAALSGLDALPAKKQQKKKAMSAKDRRRVSFAPEAELTLVHHFVKDDDFTTNSAEHGDRVEVQYGDEVAPAGQPDAQHPALAGDASDGGGAYRPGFWNKSVPENSPLTDPLLPMMLGGESPGQVSMELTAPTLPLHKAAAAQHVRHGLGPGEVTAGLPSLGALAEADELEAEEEQGQQQQQMPGEVTAALPSLGALADADEWEQEGAEGMQQQQQQVADHLTGNITAALPGLGALVEEDEDGGTAGIGMDLTVPAGRVLEHHLQQQQQLEQSPAATHPALAAEEPDAGAAELEPTLAVGRLSVGGGGGSAGRSTAGKSRQLNKWGFAPGQEDTLDINLEMHGRMIMGDQTFSRLYTDNTTGDSQYARGAGAGGDAENDTLDSLLLDDSGDVGSMGAEPEEDAGVASQGAAAAAAAAAASPALSQGTQRRQSLRLVAAAAAGPSPAQRRQSAAGAGGAVPNWAAPAFLPPYMHHAPAHSGGPSDHPALVHSPDVTNSSLGTLETRRVSVDMRRMSVSSRRFSMLDATGGLLADDDAAAAQQAAVQPPISTGPRTRRRSSGAAFLGRGDVTEKLLVDDSFEAEEEVGPLADLKRQMRMLSQGSPVVVAASMAAQLQGRQQQQAAPGGQAEEEEEGDEEMQDAPAAGEAAPPSAGQLRGAAKTPCTAVSMGYADSHNPATLRLLRSGGTTQLLGPEEAAEQQRLDEEAEEREEQEAAAEQEMELAGEAGFEAGGITARTNGTTKLLADMTMASMVGAKLRGRAPQGTPELGQGPGNNDGLTDFSLSLDEFERPPELPGGQQQRQQQPQTEAAEGMEEDEEEDLLQDDGEEAAQQQGQGVFDDYASPALPSAGREFGTGYPMGQLSADGAMSIPGGPKLARTPVTARAASQPRSARGMPHSNVRSMRSQQGQQYQQYHQHVTPGTHGTHRLGRTPGSQRPAPATYPEVDLTADHGIPGGPKLARTPMGRTPATGHLLLPGPGSAVAQHYPGSGRMVHFATGGPGSASAQRYPGSAVALHHGGMTPQFAPPPMTFQDFAKVAEVQFLDNLRRGASINYADLQPNPVPQTLGDAYRLLTVVSPQVTTLENGIRILQEEVQARRISAADAEQLVGQVNPAAFQKVATADDEGLEELRQHVGLLKKVCRQKAVYCLKDVRRQMEESRGARLQRNLDALHGDLAFAQANKEQLEGVAKAAEQFIAEQHARMAQADQGRKAEAERRTALAGMRAALPLETAANQQRRQQLQEAQERVAKLREEHSVLAREREALRRRTDALQMTLMQSQGQGAVGRESSPQAILQKMEDLDVLTACAGWQLEAAAEDPVSGELSLRLADLFRLRLNISRVGAAASVEMLPEEDCKVPADRRALLASLAGCGAAPGAVAAEVRLAEAGSATVAALVQATIARLSRVADLAAELDGLRLAHPALTDATCNTDGSLSLSFVNLDAEVKFAVSLRLPGSYPAGPVQQQARIWFGGEGQITEQRILQAVAAAAEAPGRLRAICRELSQLAREALPRPALAAASDPAFHSNWQNPLFGSGPALSAQS